MSNSPLVTCTKISPNKTIPRNHEIDTISIHCVVGQLTAEQILNLPRFVTYDRKLGASCNYAVGKDGSIGLCVEEKHRSWCTSSASNDHRAVTIEVASDTTEPYAVTDAAYHALINLLVDICRRNGIEELKWKADKSLIGQVDKQNMTVHRWFANKACPGDYLYNLHSNIADEVNRRLGRITKTEDDEMIKDTEENYKVFKAFIERYELEKQELPPSEYAKDSCRKAVESGLFLDGDGDGSLDYPQATLKRQELAAVLDRAGLIG